MNIATTEALVSETRDKMRRAMERQDIPQHMREGMLEYVINGRPMGDFLTAVFSGGLFEAVNRADEANQSKLYGYVVVIHSATPIGCSGSAERVQSWINRKGLRGILSTEENKP